MKASLAEDRRSFTTDYTDYTDYTDKNQADKRMGPRVFCLVLLLSV
jgi:hypothetical protein